MIANNVAAMDDTDDNADVCRVVASVPSDAVSIKKRKQSEIERDNGSEQMGLPLSKRTRITSEDVDATTLTRFFNNDSVAGTAHVVLFVYCFFFCSFVASLND